ncbi:hypothetical protein C0Q70_12903 [Pomacea canaliculata]|uniref:Uncharacterized protein n=1 Tax=Pomacea canaliculata TaxID=400727 RepID=A0A2T7P2U1_POMCA|nr:hypothetical protein C0Q70_12903 [Pomacea canaliculata]
MAGWKTQVYVSKTGSLETSRQEEEETSRSGVGADEGDDNIQGAGQCNDGKQLPWKEDEVEMGAGVNHKLSAIES